MTPDPSGDAPYELDLARRADVPVLITAPTHGERETCARAIHRDSLRGRAAFVTLSARSLGAGPAPGVSALPPAADGGTLFIDDIVSLDAWGQARLLALLDERRFRIVAGASRHVDRERAAGAFSETLFYRLNIIHVDLTRPATHAVVMVRPAEAVATPAHTRRSDTDWLH